MITKQKFKKIKNVVKKHFYNLTDEIKKIYNEEITSQKDVNEALQNNPSVETLFKTNRYVYQNSYCKSTDLYWYYDAADFDDNESYAKRKKILTNIFEKLGLENTIVYRYTSYGPDGKLRSAYCFMIKRGKNGSGDFVNVDMPEIADIIYILRDNGASDATPLDIFVDPADDLSDWVIGFHLDEDV